MRPFKSKEVNDLENVRAKLAKAQEECAVAEAAMEQRALQVGLDDDQATMEHAIEAVSKARIRVEMLQHAVAAAEAKDAERIRAAQADLKRAQLRAARQHLSAVERSAREFTKHTMNAFAAFDQMVEAARSADHAMQSRDVFLSRSLSYEALRAACEKELSRLGRKDADVHSPVAPGVKTEASPTHPDNIPPLADALHTRLVGGWRVLASAEFDKGELTDPKVFKLPKAELE